MQTSIPPAIETIRRRQPVLVQLWDLTLVQLSNWRWSWRGILITSMITPLLSILALAAFARGSDPSVYQYILVGNVVLSQIFSTQGRVCNNFAFMRSVGTINYFASLPVEGYSLILGTVISFLILSLPSLAVTIVAGALLLNLPLHPHPLLLVVIPAASLPLAGIGALIGASARGPEEANSISMLTTFILLGTGPVMFPPERLPEFLLILGRLSPATYAASAMRQALTGPVTGQMAVDLAVLGLFSALVFWLVRRKMDWRQSA